MLFLLGLSISLRLLSTVPDESQVLLELLCWESGKQSSNWRVCIKLGNLIRAILFSELLWMLRITMCMMLQKKRGRMYRNLMVMIKMWMNGVEGQKLEGQSATFSAKIAETADGGAKKSVVVPNRSNCCSNLSLQPTGEGGATRVPICIELKRDGNLSSKSIVLQIDSKSQPVSASALRHSLQDRLSKVSNFDLWSGWCPSIKRCSPTITHAHKESQLLRDRVRHFFFFILLKYQNTPVSLYSQIVLVLVSLLRSGPLGVKIQATTVLGSLCKENELWVKVLLGGCILLLLALLKSTKGQITAANTIYVVSEGDAKYHVGSKIFATEGVVPVLWAQLEKGSKVVDDFLTGALRNLCGTTEGFWLAIVKAGGEDILVKISTSETTKQLLKLLGPGYEPLVRAQAASTL
ncbi:unnamed protein product [Lactuca saligna]|uniref:Uncharacterized protein n=1 Tax=Lactuca saligna TaxID=75948 RepID=A0AA36EDD6_LACSI|nr:unnamed protein product [Lactuca saligna]